MWGAFRVLSLNQSVFITQERRLGIGIAGKVAGCAFSEIGQEMGPDGKDGLVGGGGALQLENLQGNIRPFGHPGATIFLAAPSPTP